MFILDSALQMVRKSTKSFLHMQARVYFFIKKVVFLPLNEKFSIFNFQFSIKITTFAP